MNGLFITATDTEVGKTVITAGLTMAMRKEGVDVGVMKPFATGAMKNEIGLYSADARFIARAAGLEMEDADTNPSLFQPPLAPLAAAESEGAEIDLEPVREAFDRLKSQHDFLLVEGIGGLRVPIKEDFYVLDLIAEFAFPALVVSRAGLGTINHTLLTLDALKSRGIPLTGVVLNASNEEMDISNRTNADMIERCSGENVLLQVPFLKDVNVEDGITTGLAQFEGFASLARHLMGI